MQRLPQRVGGLAVTPAVALDALPPDFILALLYAEDPRFLQHGGIDPWAIRLAISRYVETGGPIVGASTLSQQLAKNFFLHSDRSLSRKIAEALYARRLEHHFTKAELLTLYVNNIEWGPDVFGVAAAAAHHLATPPDALDALQCAYLVALVPDPLRRAATAPPFPSARDRYRRVAAALGVARRHPALRAYFAARGDERLALLKPIDLRAVLGGLGRSPEARASSAIRRSLDGRFWALVEARWEEFERRSGRQ
jgi:membrane carboxypeptidase/penicillin-binding protein PbpC